MEFPVHVSTASGAAITLIFFRKQYCCGFWGCVFPVLSRGHYLEARVLMPSAYYNPPALLPQFVLSPKSRCCIAGVSF